MNKVTKKDLNERLLMVETLLGLHRVLPEQISNKQANDAIFRMQCALSSGKELAERESKLKVLDQSIFNGLDKKWQFAMVSSVGIPFVYSYRPSGNRVRFSDSTTQEMINAGKVMRIDEHGYDTTDWQNSLIERDKVELTGSDLTEQIMKIQKYQAAFVSDESEKDALNSQRTALIDNVYMSDRDYRFRAELSGHRYAVPINNQGEPLTAAVLGL